MYTHSNTKVREQLGLNSIISIPCSLKMCTASVCIALKGHCFVLVSGYVC